MTLDAVSGEELVAPPSQDTTEVVRARVERCRARQHTRNGGRTNAEIGLDVLEAVARLGSAEVAFLERATRLMGLTARSWHRVIRVARTVADMDEREVIDRSDLSEALTYRALERQPVSGTQHRGHGDEVRCLPPVQKGPRAGRRAGGDKGDEAAHRTCREAVREGGADVHGH